MILKAHVRKETSKMKQNKQNFLVLVNASAWRARRHTIDNPTKYVDKILSFPSFPNSETCKNIDILLSQTWNNILLGDINWSMVREQACNCYSSAVNCWLQEHCATKDPAFTHVIPYEATTSCWEAFLGCSNLLKWGNQHAHRRWHSSRTGKVNLCVWLDDSFATVVVSGVPAKELD